MRVAVFAVLGFFFWQCGSKDKSSTAPPTNPVLSLSQQALTFEAGETQKTIVINNGGAGNLTWRARENPDQPWLAIAPDSGKAGDPMTITVTAAQLNPGTHTASIQFTSNGGDQALPLTVFISKLSMPEPRIGFDSSENSKTVQIQNLGAGKLNWSVTESPDMPWLTVNPASGENAGTLTLTVDRSSVNTGSHSGALIVTSTGGSDTLVVAMSKLPSSVFVDEFSQDLSNWTLSRASGIVQNGFLEVKGTTSGFFGTAEHVISPVKAAPWAYRLAFGRKTNSSSSNMMMGTDDAGTITVSAFRFDILSGSDRNWQAAAFLFNSSTFQGGWALLEDDSYSISPKIKNGAGAMNDVTWVMKASRGIEIYVDGALFYQSNVLNELGLSITVGLETVEIWTPYNATALADWALVRDVDLPGKVTRNKSRSAEREMVMEIAKQQAFQQLEDGTWQNLPTLKEAYERIR
jgi:hypothetical protein